MADTAQRLSRHRHEQREAELLADYACKSATSLGRVHDESEHEFRTCFQRDRDRIIHATAFRRLEYKTQVFINNAGDHYRTRLTHTLEVAQIARTMARMLSLNEDLCETIALAHDLGHPPFGHAGERVLHELLADRGGFEHNMQALRIVDLLEKRYAYFSGLNLTAETRRGILKKKPHDLNQIAGLAPRLSLEAQIVDITDEITYSTHDFDDGIESGIVSSDAIREVAMWRDAAARIDRKFPGLDAKCRRFQIVIDLINALVNDVTEETSRRLLDNKGQYDDSTVGFSQPMEKSIREAIGFLTENLYRHRLVLRENARSDRMIRRLFDHYMQYPKHLPQSFQDRIDQEGLDRTVVDYIAGMTDRFAGKDYQELFG